MEREKKKKQAAFQLSMVSHILSVVASSSEFATSDG